MKRILLFKSLLLLTVFTTRAQTFQQTFTNAFGYSSDHYSIETFEQAGGATSYAAAGTFFNSGQTIMHIFTMDQFGTIVWENYINLGALDARALDVAAGPNNSVAITGYIDYGGGPELYAAWYDPAGNLINDFQFTNPTGASTSGNNIIYSRVNDQFIIGGFESAGLTLTGKALLIALGGGFNYQWSTEYDAQCDGFDMAVINEIVEVNEHYFITGNFSAAGSPMFGQSQVLAAMVENSTGAILDNESFVATNTLGGQQAMGISAYFDEAKSILVLMYNVSISPTVDENRPYISVYEVSGVDLNYAYSLRIDDTFATIPSPMTGNPNWTGLKLIYNRSADTYLIFGMLEDYGGASDLVLSVYQEIDIFSGTLVSPGLYWTQSQINSGYLPHSGPFYSLFDDAFLRTKVYTPETATLNVDGANFVNIVPVPGTTVTYDIYSSALNTASASSACLEQFKPEIVPHTIHDLLCLNENPAPGIIDNPLYNETPTLSAQITTCPVISSEPATNAEFEKNSEDFNQLTLVSNPAQNMLQFKITQTGTYQLKVMNLEGQLLISSEFENLTGQNEIDINHLATGMYVLVTTDSKGQSMQQQFVKN